MVEVVLRCAARMNGCLQVNGRALEGNERELQARRTVSGHRDVGMLQCTLVPTSTYPTCQCVFTCPFLSAYRYSTVGRYTSL